MERGLENSIVSSSSSKEQKATIIQGLKRHVIRQQWVEPKQTHDSIGEKIMGSLHHGNDELPDKDPMDEQTAKESKEAVDAAETERNRITIEALSAFGIEPVGDELADFLETQKNTLPKVNRIEARILINQPQEDFFRLLGSYAELTIELASHLPIKQFLLLYRISKDFHEVINGHLRSSVKACAENYAAESAKIFHWKLFRPLCVLDPIGRTVNGTCKIVPGLKWLQMVVHREKVVHDILACMARQGHRMPPDMKTTLKKMWLLMDVATTASRVQFMHSKYFSAYDLYNIQFFIVKLDMRFNDPIDGPGDDYLRKLFLGQRGLTPLRNALKRTTFLSQEECIEAAIRYDYKPYWRGRPMPVFGVPAHEVGIGHLEGWGKGIVHLIRPDELVIREAVRRQLDLKNHLLGMMLWGYIDPLTGEKTPPTEEEKYMSDDEDRPWQLGWSDYQEPDLQADNPTYKPPHESEDQAMADE